MNYTTFLLATLLVVNSPNFGMELKKEVETKDSDQEKKIDIFIPDLFKDNRFFTEDGDLQKKFNKKDAHELAKKHEETALKTPSKETLQNALTSLYFLLSLEENAKIGNLLERKAVLIKLGKEKLNEQEQEAIAKDMGVLEYRNDYSFEQQNVNGHLAELMKPEHYPQTHINKLTQDLEIQSLLEEDCLKSIGDHKIILKYLKEEDLPIKKRKKELAQKRLIIAKGYRNILSVKEELKEN